MDVNRVLYRLNITDQYERANGCATVRWSPSGKLLISSADRLMVLCSQQVARTVSKNLIHFRTTHNRTHHKDERQFEEKGLLPTGPQFDRFDRHQQLRVLMERILAQAGCELQERSWGFRMTLWAPRSTYELFIWLTVHHDLYIGYRPPGHGQSSYQERCLNELIESIVGSPPNQPPLDLANYDRCVSVLQQLSITHVLWLDRHSVVAADCRSERHMLLAVAQSGHFYYIAIQLVDGKLSQLKHVSTWLPSFTPETKGRTLIKLGPISYLNEERGFLFAAGTNGTLLMIRHDNSTTFEQHHVLALWPHQDQIPFQYCAVIFENDDELVMLAIKERHIIIFRCQLLLGEASVFARLVRQTRFDAVYRGGVQAVSRYLYNSLLVAARGGGLFEVTLHEDNSITQKQIGLPERDSKKAIYYAVRSSPNGALVGCVSKMRPLPDVHERDQAVVFTLFTPYTISELLDLYEILSVSSQAPDTVRDIVLAITGSLRDGSGRLDAQIYERFIRPLSLPLTSLRSLDKKVGRLLVVSLLKNQHVHRLDEKELVELKAVLDGVEKSLFQDHYEQIVAWTSRPDATALTDLQQQSLQLMRYQFDNQTDTVPPPCPICKAVIPFESIRPNNSRCQNGHTLANCSSSLLAQDLAKHGYECCGSCDSLFMTPPVWPFKVNCVYCN